MKQILLVLLATVLLPGTASAQADERVFYASVVDGKGQPVLGLDTKDLIIREDGQSREILKVTKDEDPIQIALLVDNSVSMRDSVSELRKAISAFVAAMRPGIQIALLTLAERPTIVVPYTADHAVLQKGADRLVSYEAGNYLLDGVTEASQGLTKRAPGGRSAMVVITGMGPELSYRTYMEALRSVRESGAALHAITVEMPLMDGARRTAQSSSPVDSGNDVGRDIVLSQMSKETGGRYETVLTMSSLSAKLQQLSSEISNQYRVTFARPQRLVPPKSTEISARQPNQHARGMLMK